MQAGKASTGDDHDKANKTQANASAVVSVSTSGAHRNTRYKEKFQALRERYEKVNSVHEGRQRELDLAKSKLRELQAENDLLLDAISLTMPLAPPRLQPVPPPPSHYVATVPSQQRTHPLQPHPSHPQLHPHPHPTAYPHPPPPPLHSQPHPAHSQVSVAPQAHVPDRAPPIMAAGGGGGGNNNNNNVHAWSDQQQQYAPHMSHSHGHHHPLPPPQNHPAYTNGATNTRPRALEPYDITPPESSSALARESNGRIP